MTKYAVVEFEDGCEVVCCKWLRKEENRQLCTWPKVSSYDAHIKLLKEETAAGDDWEIVPVVAVLGKYETLNMALIKAKEAEENTDINSETDGGGKRKRRRKRNPAYSPRNAINDVPCKKTKFSRIKDKPSLSTVPPLPAAPAELLTQASGTEVIPNGNGDGRLKQSQIQLCSNDKTGLALSFKLVKPPSETTEKRKDEVGDIDLQNDNLEKKSAGKISKKSKKARDLKSHETDKQKSKKRGSKVPKEADLENSVQKNQDKEETKLRNHRENEKQLKKDNVVKNSIGGNELGNQEEPHVESNIDTGTGHRNSKDLNVLNAEDDMGKSDEEGVHQDTGKDEDCSNKPSNTHKTGIVIDKNSLTNKTSNFSKTVHEKPEKAHVSEDKLAKIQKLVSDEKAFRTFVVGELLALKSRRCLKVCEKDSSGLNKSTLPPASAILEEMSDVKSIVAFNEKLLNDPQFRDKAIQEMTFIGGADASKITRAILLKLIHPSLGSLYSWQGGKRKLKFKDLTGFVAALSTAVRTTIHKKVFVGKDATDQEICGYIKEYLRQSIAKHKRLSVAHAPKCGQKKSQETVLKSTSSESHSSDGSSSDSDSSDSDSSDSESSSSSSSVKSGCSQRQYQEVDSDSFGEPSDLLSDNLF